MSRKIVLVAVLLLASLPCEAQERFMFSANGSNGYRPTLAQAEDVEALSLFFVANGVDDDRHHPPGPIEKELGAHVAREVRRLFPGLKVSKATQNDITKKHLYVDIRVYGSGFGREMCATHASLVLTVCEPEKKLNHMGTMTTVTTADSRDVIVERTKSAISDALEMISNGWFDPGAQSGPLPSFTTSKY